jgi:hypothetical protein
MKREERKKTTRGVEHKEKRDEKLREKKEKEKE